MHGNSDMVPPPEGGGLLTRMKDKPDLIFEIEGGDKHLSGWNDINIPKIFYAVDTHLVYGFHRKIINDFDYAFIAQRQYVQRLKDIKNEVIWLPLAADPEIHRKLELPKLFDIGFVGQMSAKIHPIRSRILSELRKKYNVLALGNIYDENISKIYGLSKIGFNKSVRNDLNMRVFEVMSCGTILVHLIVYDGQEDLEEMINYYLSNDEEREKIALNGHKEVNSHHTYQERFKQIMAHVKMNI